MRGRIEEVGCRVACFGGKRQRRFFLVVVDKEVAGKAANVSAPFHFDQSKTSDVEQLVGLQGESESEIMSASSLVAEAVWKEIESTRTVTDDQLWTLHFIFGKNFEGASRIVDQRGVKRISADPSGRFIFQVTGESRRKDEYLCFAENFCACYSFFYDVVNRGEQLCCKHQIAARLAASLGAYVEVKVSDEELALLLSKV